MSDNRSHFGLQGIFTSKFEQGVFGYCDRLLPELVEYFEYCGILWNSRKKLPQLGDNRCGAGIRQCWNYINFSLSFKDITDLCKNSP